MAYVHADTVVGVQPIDVIETTQKHPLGLEVDVRENVTNFTGRAVYVAFKVSTAVAAGIVVANETLVGGTSTPFRVIAASTTTGTGEPLFVNLNAVSSNASLQYGWVLVVGVAPTLKTAVRPLAASNVGISATAGRVFISATSADQILGARFMKSSVTTTTSLVDIYINRPSKMGAVTAA